MDLAGKRGNTPLAEHLRPHMEKLDEFFHKAWLHELPSCLGYTPEVFVMDGHEKCHRARCAAQGLPRKSCGWGPDVADASDGNPLEGSLFCRQHSYLQHGVDTKMNQLALSKGYASESDLKRDNRDQWLALRLEVRKVVASNQPAGGLSEEEWEQLTAECSGAVKEPRQKLVNARTAGIQIAALPQGLICAWSELSKSESHRARYELVLRLLRALPFKLACHDDACHMRRVIHSCRRAIDPQDPLGELLLALEWVLDRFHACNHTGQYCRENVWPILPHLAAKLVGVNTSVCEKLNSWIAAFKHAVRHMNKDTFRFFFCCNFDMHNRLVAAGQVPHLDGQVPAARQRAGSSIRGEPAPPVPQVPPPPTPPLGFRRLKRLRNEASRVPS